MRASSRDSPAETAFESLTSFSLHHVIFQVSVPTTAACIRILQTCLWKEDTAFKRGRWNLICDTGIRIKSGMKRSASGRWRCLGIWRSLQAPVYLTRAPQLGISVILNMVPRLITIRLPLMSYEEKSTSITHKSCETSPCSRNRPNAAGQPASWWQHPQSDNKALDQPRFAVQNQELVAL